MSSELYLKFEVVHVQTKSRGISNLRVKSKWNDIFNFWKELNVFLDEKSEIHIFHLELDF
jgi:hypothetical protein